MDWIKILEGSGHKISEVQYNGKDGDCIIWEEPSISEQHGRMKFTLQDEPTDFDDQDIAVAIVRSLEDYEAEEDKKLKKLVDNESQLEEDEQLAKALQESLNMEPPPRRESNRICARCNLEIGHERHLRRMGAVWHPECFRCHACGLRIFDLEFSVSGNRPYHESCYKDQNHPRCNVCKNFIPSNAAGETEYRAHPFWMQAYCPSHEHDGTPRCCSCERTEGHHLLPETRGLCLSEEQTVSTISRRPRISTGYRIINMMTEPCRLVRRCEVTAILILYGLPRLLTGTILAHEMMHAWLKLKGYRNLSQDVEEGICQVLAYMWLESQIHSSSGNNVSSASTSSSSSSTSEKGARSQFEKKLGEFFKDQIETDSSPAYGDGFRAGNQAVQKYGLKSTLDHIRLTGSFPY
ncbi:hypothetical protein PVL29_004938 [Vitis rotundifolia]|uniref:LIM zinc-binding domain-containing protein n=1 Tax=Vitis rotundifolia TaxID=103349 RepID=A0AA39A9E5_VITRO|nr:hypothetical protein PVL29_004938 [Vitis rotundifolia]